MFGLFILSVLWLEIHNQGTGILLNGIYRPHFCVCFEVRSWISISKYHSPFCVQWFDVRFADIGWIVGHHWLNFSSWSKYCITIVRNIISDNATSHRIWNVYINKFLSSDMGNTCFMAGFCYYQFCNFTALNTNTQCPMH